MKCRIGDSGGSEMFFLPLQRFVLIITSPFRSVLTFALCAGIPIFSVSAVQLLCVGSKFPNCYTKQQIIVSCSVIYLTVVQLEIPTVYLLVFPQCVECQSQKWLKTSHTIVPSHDLTSK